MASTNPEEHKKITAEFKHSLSNSIHNISNDPTACFPDIPQLNDDALYVALQVSLYEI